MPVKGSIIPGSERTPLRGARVVGAVDPNERIQVTVIVRSSPSNQEPSPTDERDRSLPSERSYLTREEYETRFGAAREDLAKVEDFAQKHGLDIVEVSSARCSVKLSGSVRQFSAAFGVKLARYKHPKGFYRGRRGPIYLPPELAPIVEAVLGLDDRPQAKPHFRKSRKPAGTTYTPPQVARLYNYPTGVDGSGQCVAIIELGGGYRLSDLEAYFKKLGISTPKIVSVSVDGGANNPTGNPNGPDGEVLLDVEVVGSIAPGAQIVVYFAPNTDQGFLNAITAAIHDAHYQPSIVSISWGGPEKTWTHQALQAYDNAFVAAATLGVTVCVASGDGGSSDGETDDLAHVDFPASSPHVLGCGGTRLNSKGTVITNEIVWNDGRQGGASGGGVSDSFPLPSWQNAANVPPSTNPGKHMGRGVPDVSGDADPITGYLIRVDGKQAAIGGTSAVAPLWSGLMALINQRLGKSAGFLNLLLYSKLAAAGGTRDITVGNNGAYKAEKGWDACTGFGSPDGLRLLTALTA